VHDQRRRSSTGSPSPRRDRNAEEPPAYRSPRRRKKRSKLNVFLRRALVVVVAAAILFFIAFGIVKGVGFIKSKIDNRPPLNVISVEPDADPESSDAPDAQLPVAANFVVVIDPGHGFADGGAVTAGAVLDAVGPLTEKDVVLRLANYLKADLEAERIQVFLTHDGTAPIYAEGRDQTFAETDTYDLDQRVESGNSYNPDVFISLHCDAHDTPEPGGASVHYFLSSVNDNAPVEKLASRLSEGVAAATGRKAPKLVGTEGAGAYYLTRKVQGLSVLYEVGFLSNPKDASWLSQEEELEKVARGLAEGILQYARDSGALAEIPNPS
jgi:N-acetylmuramoyl-L-alanine amidase